MLETVSNVRQAKVLVTFIESENLDLQTLGIDKRRAAELREKFASFEDRNDQALDIYNDYDNAKSTLDE